MDRFLRAASLSNYAEVAAQVGLDAGAMLRRHDIDRRVLSDPDARLSGAKVVSLLETSAAESGCETFGLRMAETRQLADIGALSLLITYQAALRDALMALVQYRQLLNPLLMVTLEEAGEIVLIHEQLLIDWPGPMRQSYDLAVGVLYRLVRAVLGARWRALAVNFSHAAPDDLTVHRRMFGLICEFGADFNGLTCSRRDLDAPNPTADPMLAQFAERYLRTLPNADAPSLSQEIQKAIYLLLPVGQATIGKVAGSVGMNERTLQRRLDAEGSDFSRILNDVRRELTTRYLTNPGLPMSRVAGLVGYSRQSSFSRWFAEEFAMSPSAWRRTAAHEKDRGELRPAV